MPDVELARPPIPEYLDQVAKDAHRVGWEVTRTTRSITITRGGQRKPISFPLAKPPTADQVRFQMNRVGLPAALAKLEAEPEAASETKTEETPAAGLKDGQCPECAADGVERIISQPPAMGSHRRKAHGVVGTSASTARAKKTAAKKAAAKKAAPAKRAPAPKKATAPAPAPAAVAPQEEPSRVRTAVTGAISSLMDVIADEVKKETADLTRQLEQAHRDAVGLKEFKERVAAEVANGHQSPIQTLANIIKLGGEGFGTTAP